MYFEKLIIKIFDFIYYYFGLTVIEETDHLNKDLKDKYDDL